MTPAQDPKQGNRKSIREKHEFSNFSDFISTCRGETAIGNGSRFPRVISTSINPNKGVREAK